MLRGLDIRNVAVIEKLNLEFFDGMTVLTGETGAGKSIIIDSINMILGARTNKSLVRHNEEKAFVSACFDATKDVIKMLEAEGIEIDEQSIIISREVNSEGKSVARINGVMVPLNTLREISGNLVNIHGQQDNQAILDKEKHAYFLDAYANNEKILLEYEEQLKKVKDIKKRLFNSEIDEQEKLRRIDLLRYQTEEIEKAKLIPGEKERLLEERILVKNSADISAKVSEAYHILYENDNMAAYDAISLAVRALESISEYDKNIEGLFTKLVDIKYAVEDIVHELRGMDLEYDEGYLNEIEERLDVITSLEKKYGGTTDEVLSFFESASKELENIINSDELIKKLKEELKEEENILKNLGERLFGERKKAAERLSEEIIKELSELDMEKAVFKVLVEHTDEFFKNGMDLVEFLISANPGEPLKPLTSVASGGELSRTMLAVKTVLAGCGGAETLIFDEIDTGVSGRAAQKIAAKLWGLGREDQVICISHQPQLAAYADNHYYIEKNINEERAKTTVRNLNEEERKLELARIIDGSDITETAVIHAGEMIFAAREKKKGK